MISHVVKVVAALLLTLVPATAWAQSDGRRVALIVGNASYRNVPSLANPLNDANLVANALHSAGFQIVGGRPFTNLDKRSFEAAFQQFAQQATGADVALFFYAGHGIQMDGTNWLVPITAAVRTEQDVPSQLVDLSDVVTKLSRTGARLSLLILDACRNNPFADDSPASANRGVPGNLRLRGASQAGLAYVTAPNDMIVAYSTQPGNVALDDAGGNSPYSKALAFGIRNFKGSIQNVLNTIGMQVSQQTNGVQRPWLSMSPVSGFFSFGQMPIVEASSDNAWIVGSWVGQVAGYGERVFLVERVGQGLVCSWGGGQFPVGHAHCSITSDAVNLVTGTAVKVSLRLAGQELVGTFTPPRQRARTVRMRRSGSQ